MYNFRRQGLFPWKKKILGFYELMSSTRKRDVDEMREAQKGQYNGKRRRKQSQRVRDAEDLLEALGEEDERRGRHQALGTHGSIVGNRTSNELQDRMYLELVLGRSHNKNATLKECAPCALLKSCCI
jgi:hypothetical protein